MKIVYVILAILAGLFLIITIPAGIYDNIHTYDYTETYVSDSRYDTLWYYAIEAMNNSDVDGFDTREVVKIIQKENNVTSSGEYSYLMLPKFENNAREWKASWFKGWGIGLSIFTGVVVLLFLFLTFLAYTIRKENLNRRRQASRRNNSNNYNRSRRETY